MKKGQMEILGVAIIVIILVIAGVIMLKMGMSRKGVDSGSFVDPETAQSLLNALMNTKTDKNVIVSQIIKDCYAGNNGICSSTTTADCCEYAAKTITNALEATLGEWNRDYKLTIKKGGLELIGPIPQNSKCTDRSEQEQPGSYPIPPPPPIIVTLQICK